MDKKTAIEVFFELHSQLPREGPGDDISTSKAFSLLPDLPDRPSILDLGCGPGMQTLQLLKLTNGQVTAVDIHQPYLEQLQQSAEAAGLSDRLTLLHADMNELPFSPENFDLIWAEGSAYILEFGNALRKWRSLLRHPGYLVASEISWIRDDPPQPVVDFWSEEYPNLQSMEANLALCKTFGYVPIGHFLLPATAWWQHYYTPLEERVNTLLDKYADQRDALKILRSHQWEMDLFRQYSDYYGYVFYILQMDPLNHNDTLTEQFS